MEIYMYSFILAFFAIVTFLILCIIKINKQEKIINHITIILLVISLISCAFGVGMIKVQKNSKPISSSGSNNESKQSSKTYTEQNSSNTKTVEEIARLRNRVVLILTEKSQGSGVIINKDGYIVTNYHVIKDAYSYRAGFEGDNGKIGDNIGLQLISYDKDLDIALLKLEDDKIYDFIEIANSNDSKVGEKIITIGNPEGMINSLSEGIISGIRKQNEYTYIQISAAISPGSSGGALLNMQGNLVGITTFKIINGENLNFAISSNDVKKFLDSEKTKEYVDKYKKGDSFKVIEKNNEYILPNSSESKLTINDIKSFNLEKIRLARNEIYARHGYIFTKGTYRDYFSKKSWYRENPNFKESDISQIEKYNVSFLKYYEEVLVNSN